MIEGGEVKPMNNIEILEEKIKQWEPYKNVKWETPIEKEIARENQAIENLIKENKELRIQISARETVVDKLTKENKDLKEENHELKEKLQMFIPRRRVRRVYKMLGKILRTDIDPILLEKELKQKDLEEGE